MSTNPKTKIDLQFEEFNVFEPMMKSRFVVEFPTACGISTYACYKISPLILANGKWHRVTMNLHPIPGLTGQMLEYDRLANKTLLVHQLDTVGNILETWKIMVTDVCINLGDSNMTSDEFRDPSISFTPWHVTLEL